MPDPTDSVPVLLQDLELIQRTLDHAEALSTAVDLQHSIRDLKSGHQPSKLSRMLANTSRRVRGIIASVNDEVTDDDPSS